MEEEEETSEKLARCRAASGFLRTQVQLNLQMKNYGDEKEGIFDEAALGELEFG